MASSDSMHLLRELEPIATANFNRHLAVAKDWLPHEYVPWGQGRDFADLGGVAWEPGQSAVSAIARTALEVNLLTEDNLPSYHREIERTVGRDGVWGEWVHRWTAEENRHGICIRDYLVVTRAVDPAELERSRMQTMQTGFALDDKPLLRVFAYVSFQELATRISHRNTGRYTQEPIADRLLARVAADENLHMIFYRDLVTAALQVAPDETMRAIADEVIGFQMPGAVIAGFLRKAALIAKAGIYDLRIHHDEVIWPLLRHWGIFQLGELGPSGEIARTELAEFLTQLAAKADQFEQRRDQALARRSA